MSEDILSMEHITKVYENGFIANEDVSLSVRKGEIHALVGENGAGKTTLMNILFGFIPYQEGRILINGEEVHITGPLDAIEKGIGMVHQHFMQMPSLTVAENVVLGMEPVRGVIFDRQEAAKITQEISDKYDLKVNADDIVADLPIGLRQKVELLKALVRNCKLLILDEPTAVLTPQETEELFVQLKELKKNGFSIIFISHKLEEVMKLCDRVTVLRRGRSVGSGEIKDLTTAELSKMIVGRDVVTEIEKEKSEPKKDILSVEGLRCKNKDYVEVVKGIDLKVRAGEILGVAGVEGNGQVEVAEAITGMLIPSGGNIRINGKNIRGKTIKQIKDLGLSYISEDRLKYGCAPLMPIRENLMADRIDRKEYKKFGLFLDRKKIDDEVKQLIREYEIKCDDGEEEIRMLSGGNIQKVIVAREMSSGANLIVANQPTRGIDVGTTDLIRKTLIRKTREENVGVLLITSDLNEVLELSDRMIVMKDGQIVAHFNDVKKVSDEQLGEYMLGIRKMSPEEMEGLS
ncbi:MAG: ABC transporter ATP-binding protein [Erysipelotrichaceae bacterium]|nr:ABC transporter ATP-binding protein [Erysipelotrichaceae bacterium]